MGDTGSWLVRRDARSGDLIVVDEVSTARERKLKAWARALGSTSSPPSQESEAEWAYVLKKRIGAVGAKALRELK